jgi:hypothetical protein
MLLTWSIPLCHALDLMMGIVDEMIAVQVHYTQRELARDGYMISKEAGEI